VKTVLRRPRKISTVSHLSHLEPIPRRPQNTVHQLKPYAIGGTKTKPKYSDPTPITNHPGPSAESIVFRGRRQIDE
jgi:hypothetical protein